MRSSHRHGQQRVGARQQTPPAFSRVVLNFYLTLTEPNFQTPPTLVAWSFNFTLITTQVAS